MFNLEKTAQIAAYLLRKYNNTRLNYTKLIKMMYLADRESFNAIGHSMTGDKFCAMPKGPVLSGLYSLIIGKGDCAAQTLWDERFLTEGFDIFARSQNLPVGRLSRFEKRVLDELDAKFHNDDYGVLIEYTHNNCPEWSDPSPAGSKEITSAEILAALGCSEREIELIEAENAAYEREQTIIASVEGG